MGKTIVYTWGREKGSQQGDKEHFPNPGKEYKSTYKKCPERTRTSGLKVRGSRNTGESRSPKKERAKIYSDTRGRYLFRRAASSINV